APVLDGTIRGDQGGRLFVSSHHELEQILGRGLWELAHPEVVDDQERDGGDHREVLLARARELRLREFVQERMRLAIEDTMALLDDGETEGLRQVALAGARRAQKEGAGVLRNPPRRRELEDEGAVHLLVELEVKGVEPLVAVAEARGLDPSL